MKPMRRLSAAIGAACCIGCGDPSTSPGVSPPIDRLLIYATNWPTEEVEFAMTRNAGESTVVLFRPARPGRPRLVLDSIGPSPTAPEEVRAMLASFDIWAMNAPNARDAACKTVNGQRTCVIAEKDYSLVMLVERGGQVRVQRYTGLERSTANPSARGLGDFVLAWARKRQPPPPPGSATQVVQHRNAHDLERAVRTNR